MSRWMKRWRFWACIGLTVAVFSYMGWQIYSNQQKNAPKPLPPSATGQYPQVLDLQKGVIQPVREIQSGAGVNYDSKTEPNPTPVLSPTPEKIVVDPPLVLCDFPMPAPTPNPTPYKEEPPQDDRFLSRFTFIPVKLLVELDSSHMTTPVLAIVTDNIWQQTSEGKKLIIEAGCQIGAFLAPGYVRSNVEIKGEMTLIFLDGLELTFDGIFCNQEYDPWSHHYGLYDKSGGIKGQLVQSDHFAFVRNMVGFLMQAGSQALDAGTGTVLQQLGRNGNVNSLQVSPGQAVINPYIEKMINPVQLADTVFVQVPNGKKAYVVNTTVIRRGLASVGAQLQAKMKKEEELKEKSETETSFDLNHAKKLLQVAEKQVLKEEEPKDEEKPDPNAVLK